MALRAMHLRGAEFALTDAMHIAVGGVTVLLMMLAIAFGAASFGKWFRIYSMVTLVFVVVFGVLTGLDGPGVAANTPTPLIGIWERISPGVYLIWVMALALKDWPRNPQVKMLGITVAHS